MSVPDESQSVKVLLKGLGKIGQILQSLDRNVLHMKQHTEINTLLKILTQEFVPEL